MQAKSSANRSRYGAQAKRPPNGSFPVPTAWRRTGAGENARARPPPAVPEVFGTHRSAFRRLTLPDRFPIRAFPTNEKAQPPAVPVCSAGNAAGGFGSTAPAESVFQAAAQSASSHHTAPMRLPCFSPADIRPARCPKRQAGPQKKRAGLIPCPLFARRSLRAALHSAQRPAAGFTAGRSAPRFSRWSFRIPQRSA